MNNHRNNPVPVAIFTLVLIIVAVMLFIPLVATYISHMNELTPQHQPPIAKYYWIEGQTIIQSTEPTDSINHMFHTCYSNELVKELIDNSTDAKWVGGDLMYFQITTINSTKKTDMGFVNGNGGCEGQWELDYIHHTITTQDRVNVVVSYVVDRR